MVIEPFSHSFLFSNSVFTLLCSIMLKGSRCDRYYAMKANLEYS